jgi:transposase, IS30 family
MPYLTEVQRYQIEHDIRDGKTNARIAYLIGCSERTIEREIARCGKRGDYRATVAQGSRNRCAARSTANHPLIPAEPWRLIESVVGRKGSPAQVVGEYRLNVSVSGVYRRLRREKKVHLLTQLRHHGATQKRGGKSGGMDWVKRAQSIHDRPKEIDTRDTIGHHECDSIVGKRNEPYKIVGILDRALRFLRLGWVPDGSAAGVAKHFTRWLSDQSVIPILSVTTDQGCEFSALPELLPGCLYACDPGKPYQKGQIEHVNKLIRQYIPKGMSLRHMTQAKLDWIANEINHRARKRLGWKSPAALLSELTTAPTG